MNSVTTHLKVLSPDWIQPFYLVFDSYATYPFCEELFNTARRSQAILVIHRPTPDPGCSTSDHVSVVHRSSDRGGEKEKQESPSGD